MILRELRKSKKLKQKQLGDALGVSKNSVANWEKERVKISPEHLKQVAEFFNVKPEYVLSNNKSDFDYLYYKPPKMVRKFAYGLKAARKKAGMSQVEVASKIDNAQSCYSTWEVCKVDVAMNKLEQLAKILNTTVEQLTTKPQEQ